MLNPSEGRAFLRVRPRKYGQAYFDKYVTYEASGFALKLNRMRADLVDRYIGDAPVVDVGIGCGSFIKVRANTLGYDVGQPAIDWLNERGLWFDIENQPCLHATFWDSLEHIRRCEAILSNVQYFVFVSIPVFRSLDSIGQSRHFRPDEHWHYFTVWGFVKFMQKQGFELLEMNRMEEALGREQIGTFVFKRVP